MSALTTIPTLTGKIDLEHDGALSANDLFDGHNSMPALAGSEKQVEWARTIRRDATADMAERLKGFNPPAERRDALFAAAEDAIKNQTSAHWWIENRHHAKGINGHALNDILRAELAKTLPAKA